MPSISAADRASAARVFELLKTSAGKDGRLSQDDVRTAERTNPAQAPLVDAFVDFLKSSSVANGRSMVSMVDPLGTGETSAAKVCDQFLATRKSPVAVDVPAAARPCRPLPTREQVSHLMGVLTSAAGQDGRLGAGDFAVAYARHPDQVALLAQLGTFLKAVANARGENLSMRTPGGAEVTRAELCDAFIAHLAQLREPAAPARPPKQGAHRPIPGTRDVNAPQQVYQYGEWLEFTYDPALKSTGPRSCAQFDAADGEWRRGSASSADAKAQLAWERANPKRAEKVRAALGGVLEQLESDAIEAEIEHGRALREWLNPAPHDPWGGHTDNLRVRLDSETRRLMALFSRDSGAGSGGRPRTPAADSSGRIVNTVDFPGMNVVDPGGNLVSDWIAGVDARWNAATGNNFNGGTFVYGAPGR